MSADSSLLSRHYPLPLTLTTLSALYLAQGLPSGLFAHALPVFWREAGVALGWIGALKLLALPWVLKALWAPAIDRSLQRGTVPGRWIAWLQLTAVVMLVALIPLGLAPSGNQLFMVVALILIINTLMATQDVVTDGLTVRWIHPRWRGLANTVQVAGYKVGMLVGGALLLALANYIGGANALLIPALLLLFCYLLIARATPLRQKVQTVGDEPGSLRDGFTGFLSQPGVPRWLVLMACYKVADAMGSGMIRPMLTDAGWSRPDIATFTLVTTLTGLGGAILGGWLYQRLGSRRSLLYAGLAQAITIAGWSLADTAEASTAMVYTIGILEQFADGASTVALFAVMMSLCRKGWEGTDFTVQASVQVVCAGVFGLAGGVVAQIAGYTALLVLAALLGVAVLAVLVRRSPSGAQRLMAD